MADTDFYGFTLVTSLQATDGFLGYRAGGGINFTRSTLFQQAGQIYGRDNVPAGYVSNVLENQATNGYAQRIFNVGAAGANGQAQIGYAPGIFFAIGPTANDTTTPIVFRTNNATERMRIAPDGKVGVNTALARAPFQVNGAGLAAYTTSVTSAGSPLGAQLYLGDSNFDLATYWNSAPGIGAIYDTANGGVAGALGFYVYGGTPNSRSEAMRVSADGNLIVGVTGNVGYHRIEKPVAQAGNVMMIRSTTTGQNSLTIFGVSQELFSAAGCGINVGRNSSTSRSINAGGTVNASGADYAEYMRKSEGCGEIAKGEVCGVDANGELTTTWAEAIGFVVKSTDPSYVGGDTWGTAEAVGPRPQPPVLQLPAYEGPAEPNLVPAFTQMPPTPQPAPEPPIDVRGPQPVEPVRDAGEDDVSWMRRVYAYIIADAEWQRGAQDFAAAQAAYPEQVEAVRAANLAAQEALDQAQQQHAQAVAAYGSAKAEYDAARAAFDAAVADAEAAHEVAIAVYQDELTAWEAQLEAARQKVDRIAFSGQVPCIVTGDFAVGDYIVAEPGEDGGIVGVAVPGAEISFDQYKRRIGKVWAVRDGKAWLDVQHG